MISVVIPHRNQPNALLRVVRALQAQRDPRNPFEIIVTDNGSDKPMPQDITAYPNVSVVHETQPGPGPARNRGALHASGSILAFIDADCIPERNWLKEIAQHFYRPNAAGVIGGDVRIIPRGQKLTAIEAYESIFGYRFELYIKRDRFAGTGNLAMRRDIFQSVGPFGGIEVAEDRDWGQRASRAGFPPVYIPRMIVYTEARRNFPELARKWDRHVAHEFAAVQTAGQKLLYFGRSLAILGSPLVEIPRVATSKRLSNRRAKVLAWCILVRIRLFRARRMWALLLGADPRALAIRWYKRDPD